MLEETRQAASPLVVYFPSNNNCDGFLSCLEPQHDTGGITEIVLTVSTGAGLQVVHLSQSNADNGSDIHINSATNGPGCACVRAVDAHRIRRSVDPASQSVNEGREVSRVRQTDDGSKHEGVLFGVNGDSKYLRTAISAAEVGCNANIAVEVSTQ